MLKRNTVKARHYLNIGTLMQNTARQSKTQDHQNTHSYLRLTRQAADTADIIQSIQQTCHAGIHFTRPKLLLPFYSLLSLLYLTSPIHFSPTENSSLCSLLKYISQQAASPCGQLSITRDRPRKSLTVHTWTSGLTPPPKKVWYTMVWYGMVWYIRV